MPCDTEFPPLSSLHVALFRVCSNVLAILRIGFPVVVVVVHECFVDQVRGGRFNPFFTQAFF